MLNIFLRPLSLLCLVTISTLLYQGLSHQLELSSLVFVNLAAISQTFLFCLPVGAAALLIARCNRNGLIPSWQRLIVHSLVLTSMGLLYANYKLYSIYGFYINGFVLNILSTPGGIGALGLNSSFFITLSLGCIIFIATYAISICYIPFEKIYFFFAKFNYKTLTIFAIFIAQALLFSLSEHTGNIPILQASKNIAWYVPVTAKSLYNKMGIDAREDGSQKLPGHTSDKFKYSQITSEQPAIKNKYNIVWLVAESLRADMLNARVMPGSYDFSKNNIRFLSHYSGGNGTRMGMFTQFYGLYGNYWFDILDSRTAPSLLKAIKSNNYAMKAFTSATFTYPEFGKTIFREFDDHQLQSYTQGFGWERDQKNVSDLIEFLDSANTPQFAFMFFESSHANYYFPDESVIEPDYMEDFDYLATNIEKSIKPIKSRYINATHHLDSQIARILDYLESSGKLEETIVVITGDHGEEFMEKGRWGHNSTFSEEQIRVPLILHIPDARAREISKITSHLDIPATVASVLGINSDRIDVGFGQNLLDQDYQRDFAVVSDWHGSALVSKGTKRIMSSGALVDGNRATSRDDQPFVKGVMPDDTLMISQYLDDLNYYFR